MDLGLIEHTRAYIYKLIKNKKRIDGRKPFEYRRHLRIYTNVFKNAEGSAIVELGNTKVMAGIKLDVGEPFPDTPDKGIIIVNLEFLPASYPTYEPGPPGADAIELARVIDRGIREANTIPLEDLVIEPGEKVWIIFADLYVMNDDGNIVDAGNLAILSALLSTRFPEYDQENNKVLYGTKTDKKLKLKNLPIAITFRKIEDQWILDPNKDEEIASIAGITLTSTEDENIRAIQKYGSGIITQEELDLLLDLSIEKAKVLRNKLKYELKKQGIEI